MASEANRPAKTKESDAPLSLAELVHSTTADLRAVAADSRLTEELALALLNRRDIEPAVLEALASNASVMKLRRVSVGVASHPKTPRFVSMPITRRLYTFELMKISQLPTLATDLKVNIEEAIIVRLATVSAGERQTLAKQGSTRIAGALLNDAETRVMRAALENPKLTETAVVHAILRPDSSQTLVLAVSGHSKWALRREVQIALLRNEKTPLARAIQFAKGIPKPMLRDVLQSSRLSAKIKSYLAKELESQK